MFISVEAELRKSPPVGSESRAPQRHCSGFQEGQLGLAQEWTKKGGACGGEQAEIGVPADANRPDS